MHYKTLSTVFLCILSASIWANEGSTTEVSVTKVSANETAEKFGTSPVLNNGRKWRIVFYEGGPHANYYNYLEATIRGLMKLGWIEKSDLKQIQSKKKNQMIFRFLLTRYLLL